MKYCFYITVLLFLVIIQTVILPCFPLFNQFYDLMIPFVIFLGMFRPARESIAVVICSGLIMDTLSGGYFGLYISIYIWLFLAVKWAVKFLQLRHGAILPLASATGVVMENAILFGAITFLGPSGKTSFLGSGTMTIQLVWAIFTGPFFLMGLNQVYCRWVRFAEDIFIRKDKYNR